MVAVPREKMWWLAEKGEVHKILLDYVYDVDRRMSDHLDRFAMLESMYDPNGPAAQQADPRWRKDLLRITENVIASTVDTVRSAVSTTEVLPRFPTDGADWSTQRKARLLEAYSEEIQKLLDVGGSARQSFFGGSKKGTGCVHVYADENDRPRVESVPIDNILVDDVECQNGAQPRQLHYRQIDVDRDWLRQQFPEHEEAIEAAADGGASGGWRRQWSRWSLPGGRTRNDVFVIESWHLPMGVRPDDHESGEVDGYIPGRHVICINGADLLDEEWHKDRFPFSVFRWGERENSFYGVGLAERIIGHQRTLNKRNWQRDRQLDLVAVPTTYVRPADINAQAKTTQAGTWIPIKGEYPLTVVPQAVGAEILQDRHDAKASAFEETGVSRMAAAAVKPGGLDSGVALREYRDQYTQRFSLQEKGFEAHWLDIVFLVLDVCKDLGSKAPKMSRRSRFGPRTLKWRDVEMSEVKVLIAAASALNRTPAGRVQMVLEFAQGGIISQDEARRLIRHPDLESELSLYTASLEAIEEDLEAIEDGNFVIPEPFINLKMAVWRAQNRLLLDRGRGAPEEVLEGLRNYAVQAAYILKGATPNMAQPPGGMVPGGMAPELAPPMTSPMQVPASAPPMLPPGQPAM